MDVECSSNPIDLALLHLQAELARIDVFIQRAVRRWQLAGQDPADAFRGLHVSDADANALLSRPFGSSWGQVARRDREDERAFAQALARSEQHIQSVIDQAQRDQVPLRLAQLTATCELGRFELDAFLICLAPALDLRYRQLYGYLQNDVTRQRPTVNLILDLLCESGPAERLRRLAQLGDDAPLFRHFLLARVVEPGAEGASLLGQPLSVDEATIAWLLGHYRPHVELGTHAALAHAQARADDRLLAAQVQRQLADLLRLSREDWPVVVFYGVDRDSQHAAARLLAAHIHRPLLSVDLAGVIQDGAPLLRALRLALRDARLTGAAPYLTGWDACLVDDAPWAELLAELCAFPGLIIVAGRESWQARGIERERRLFWVEFPTPVYAQRQALWRHFLRRDDLEPAVTALAGQFALTTEQIRDAIASAEDIAAQRGGALQGQDLFVAARAHSSPGLSSLARKIEPRYSWDDIVLPDDQMTMLREIVDTVRGRPQVLKEWGVGTKLTSSDGVTILFAGPPGTGKTMAAEVIAAELRLDLFKIDLSTVVSKYIGETEKNLEKIFSEAQSSNAILFFDEADAIFGKRSEVKDAHDRYANVEISYLLQRMEAYDGVTILATNLRANLDEAFTRRLQFALDFPFPEKEYRLRIWRTLFPPDVPHAVDLDFALLADRFKLAGGNIRNILVGAAYLAAADGGRVEMKHLLHGMRRELQKMGRLVNEADLTV